MSQRTKLKLKPNDKVFIVGGGPAGSFSAIHLLTFAKKENLNLDVTIFESNLSEEKKGAVVCKGCGGVLSSRFLRSFSELNLEIPQKVIQSELTSYMLHVQGQNFTINKPERRKIFSIFRGSGPFQADETSKISFDNFLRDHAIKLGAKVTPKRIDKIEINENPAVHYDNTSEECNFLVLATGINRKIPEILNSNFKAPDTIPMAQNELNIPSNWPMGRIAVFYEQPTTIRFGALIPKGKYLNISILPKEKHRSKAMDGFINSRMDILHDYFKDKPNVLCSCAPKISVSSAKNYYGNRWVAVGDIATTRFFKDGIGAAYLMSKRAMKTALFKGISKRDFQLVYAPYCYEMAFDNLIGKGLFNFFSLVLKSNYLTSVFLQSLLDEKDLPQEKKIFSKILWGLLTGEYLYTRIFIMFFKPRSLLILTKNFIYFIFHKKRVHL